MKVICAHCGSDVLQAQNYINRAQRESKRIYCDRKCAGLARRRAVPLTESQRKAAKSEYDRQRRAVLGERLRAEKRAAYYANHEHHLAKGAEYRKTRMPMHVEYCRQPAYVAWKREYDRRYRAKEFGEFAEAFLLLQDVEREVDSRASRYEIYMSNGTINKAQTRRREL